MKKNTTTCDVCGIKKSENPRDMTFNFHYGQPVRQWENIFNEDFCADCVIKLKDYILKIKQDKN